MPSSVLGQIKVKTDALNNVVINEIFFCINTLEMLESITPNILVVIPEKLQLVISHTHIIISC